MWSAYDFSDPQPRCEKFAARLPKDDFDRFYREYEKALTINNNIPDTLTKDERENFLKKQEGLGIQAADKRKEDAAKKEEEVKK